MTPSLDRSNTARKVVSDSTRQTDLPPSSPTDQTSINASEPRVLKLSVWSGTIQPALLALLGSFLAALLLLAWEDVTCSLVLPSRSRTSLPVNNVWAASTIRGMGFGASERAQIQQQLQDEAFSSTGTDSDIDSLLETSLLSYNEVMETHRTERVARWKSHPSNDNVDAIPSSIHVLVACWQQIATLRALANDYQWDTIRSQLRSAPWTDLEPAASSLRQYQYRTARAVVTKDDDVIGFDWGSCAWRHCGALADVVEASDELDTLLGVLEPLEANFCFDVMERSLRDMLTVLPWTLARPDDAAIYARLPTYQPHRVFDPEDELEEGEVDPRLDDAYLQALQDLRID